MWILSEMPADALMLALVTVVLMSSIASVATTVDTESNQSLADWLINWFVTWALFVLALTIVVVSLIYLWWAIVEMVLWTSSMF